MGRRTIYSILAAVLLGISGCRGDRSPEVVPTQAQDQAETAITNSASPVLPAADDASDATDKRALVVCFGDSLTAGHGASLGASYPDFLQKDLDRDGFHVRVVNQGISGDTTKDGIDRLPEVLALKPQIVVLEFGGNDGLRGLNLETTRQNLATMIDALDAAHIKVVIAGITLPPDYGPDYVSRFTANYPALGKQFHLPVLPFLLKDVYGVPGMMQEDRTHATDKGNEVVAKNVLPYVERLLKR